MKEYPTWHWWQWALLIGFFVLAFLVSMFTVPLPGPYLP